MADDLDILLSRFRDAFFNGSGEDLAAARAAIREHFARAEQGTTNIATARERRRCVEANMRAFITHIAPAILASPDMPAETIVAILTGYGEALQLMLRGEG